MNIWEKPQDCTLYSKKIILQKKKKKRQTLRKVVFMAENKNGSSTCFVCLFAFLNKKSYHFLPIRCQ